MGNVLTLSRRSRLYLRCVLAAQAAVFFGTAFGWNPYPLVGLFVLPTTIITLVALADDFAVRHSRQATG